MVRENGIVTSYRNPDTDGVACGIALSAALSRGSCRYGRDLGGLWVPAFAGALGDETLIALAWADVEAPMTVDDGALVRLVEEAGRAALVDTHHTGQLPQGFPCESVRVVVDHHPNGDDDLFPQAFVDNREIGAAASALIEALDADGMLDSSLAGILAAAVVSNTLNFTAPTTTPFDRIMYSKAVAVRPLPESVVADMLGSRSSVFSRGTRAALESDFKLLETSCGRVGVSQIEAYGLIDKVDVEDVRFCLREMARASGAPCIFNGVDLRRGMSLVVCADAESERVARGLLGLPFTGGYETVGEVLLRKSHFSR